MSASSPKRKRGGHISALDTKLPNPRLIVDSNLEDHVESPRTKVAKQFDNLDIHGNLEKLDHHNPMSTPTQRMGDIAQDSTKLEAPPRVFASLKSKRNLQSSPVIAPDSGPALAQENTPRSKSPSLEGEPSEEFWHDSEITGHNPDDPDDVSSPLKSATISQSLVKSAFPIQVFATKQRQDGYGINGIGFKPTAALAWSRSEQRKQQLIEYKNREAREARGKRSERRKRVFDDGDQAPPMDSSPRKAARVHFEDG